MVKIRLRRFGRKKRPYYRIVVQDSRRKRDGKYIDLIGFYHPLSNESQQYKLNKEKVLLWHKRGAQATDTVRNLINKSGIELSRK